MGKVGGGASRPLAPPPRFLRLCVLKCVKHNRNTVLITVACALKLDAETTGILIENSFYSTCTCLVFAMGGGGFNLNIGPGPPCSDPSSLPLQRAAIVQLPNETSLRD